MKSTNDKKRNKVIEVLLTSWNYILAIALFFCIFYTLTQLAKFVITAVKVIMYVNGVQAP